MTSQVARKRADPDESTGRRGSLGQSLSSVRLLCEGTAEMDVPGPERRLAAVLAADMVGYSRLMEVDETGTLALHRWVD